MKIKNNLIYKSREHASVPKSFKKGVKELDKFKDSWVSPTLMKTSSIISVSDDASMVVAEIITPFEESVDDYHINDVIKKEFPHLKELENKWCFLSTHQTNSGNHNRVLILLQRVLDEKPLALQDFIYPQNLFLLGIGEDLCKDHKNFALFSRIEHQFYCVIYSGGQASFVIAESFEDKTFIEQRLERINEFLKNDDFHRDFKAWEFFSLDREIAQVHFPYHINVLDYGDNTEKVFRGLEILSTSPNAEALNFLPYEEQQTIKMKRETSFITMLVGMFSILIFFLYGYTLFYKSGLNNELEVYSEKSREYQTQLDSLGKIKAQIRVKEASLSEQGFLVQTPVRWDHVLNELGHILPKGGKIDNFKASFDGTNSSALFGVTVNNWDQVSSFENSLKEWKELSTFKILKKNKKKNKIAFRVKISL